ncbi:tRNA (adenosine(37)-N6)-threonylcarbamoyltransferase complex transferase subunit TsaD [Mesoplasma lactucae]|uniref:tRNA N6-adenosine threonylcarbamoyltransferase n=1 Tax=Mesoplasma lactucae ATCC 49193 TaxID=81460 RepID=A0A291IRY4_9MOLU|nr:tRNA (adenosine(37)-N6)-threonylcarbamoyltransferase complex transferase subunit TsaD [Mesoplasma lactucae]ATG97622.1 tRNA (adenosine(37)-N6)-threonylcarbamoyltransferase complex transferase subunit TsaD [Mesoplasma lactucae ATCC 49193]ATZ19917.1 tRNA N6-adenosine(37)-threonylcarbamoyltransferase complex transferase subunit TsaD [Mesoplasma lactucae ATCC 49193]MCL8216781.1 tRNA N6-adenosine threonylcarbamoyltransferase [Mesoplasma lactucae ATCC 49193]
MKILAIESSCDEFAIAIMDDGKLLCNVISSQIDQHKEYGGVVPELAARLHLQNSGWVLREALEQSKINIEDIDMVAYTAKPGLIGSLIIGKVVAETIAMYINKPLVPLDHIEGHIYGAAIDHNFEYPVLAMVVSGGHTQIEIVNSPMDFKIIGATEDDAIGECYDKVARVMGLEYPGGPLIDKLAQTGNPERYKLPLAKNDDSYDFSYSGLKTATINLIHNAEQKGEEINKNDLAASFQKSAIEIIKIKLNRAIEQYRPKTLTVAGGVSANSLMRKTILELGKDHNIKNTIIPEMSYCTDNGAMIAKLCYEKEMFQNKNKIR